MKLSEELTARGFIYQYSADAVADIFDGPARIVYLGVDPTADSMHVGHLVPYMMLNHIMRGGHSVIALLGGGTALIGDPSFKEQERDIADVETIKDQCAGLEKNIRSITTNEDIRFVNNYDWLHKLNAIEFLRDVGKHFTVNAMVKKDAVSRRFESEHGISYTEFSYALLQAYDFYHLFTTYGCTVQIGGSDQWGNILAGVDYVRRRTQTPVYGVTMPLIVDRATGKKFGKSEGNAVWLDAEKTTPFVFYQFWFNTSDESVFDYLKLFTFLPLKEIAELEIVHDNDPGARKPQRALAAAVTTFVHGEASAARVERVSDALFGTVTLASLTDDERSLLQAEAPWYEANATDSLVAVVFESGLSSSKREARTFVEQGAVSCDGQVVTNPNAVVPTPPAGDLVLLKRGKKRVAVVRVVPNS